MPQFLFGHAAHSWKCMVARRGMRDGVTSIRQSIHVSNASYCYTGCRCTDLPLAELHVVSQVLQLSAADEIVL